MIETLYLAIFFTFMIVIDSVGDSWKYYELGSWKRKVGWLSEDLLILCVFLYGAMTANLVTRVHANFFAAMWFVIKTVTWKHLLAYGLMRFGLFNPLNNIAKIGNVTWEHIGNYKWSDRLIWFFIPRKWKHQISTRSPYTKKIWSVNVPNQGDVAFWLRAVYIFSYLAGLSVLGVFAYIEFIQEH